MTLVARSCLCAMVAYLIGPCLCQANPHPTRVDEHSNCVECHADHATGDYVHPAVKLGCTSCHSVENQTDATYVTLKQTKSVICFECHQPEKFVNPHLPYSSGMCMRCHDPHVSVNARLLRGKVNDLCLQCHLSTPKKAPSRYLPTIELTVNNTIGHPYLRHPVGGTRDPVTGDEMCCISCHLSHGGTKLHHLKMASEIPEDALNENTETNDMCHKCHLILWGLSASSSGKKHNRKKPN